MTLLAQLIELRLLSQKENLMIQFVLERAGFSTLNPLDEQTQISLFLTILCYENSLGRVRLQWSRESFDKIFTSMLEEYYATCEYHNYEFEASDMQSHQIEMNALQESDIIDGLSEVLTQGEMKLTEMEFSPCPRVLIRVSELGHSYYYFQKNYHAEVEILKGINTLLKLSTSETLKPLEALKEVFSEPFILPKDDTTGLHFQFHERQVLAAYLAAQSPFFIISGGPGTGKTSVLVQVLRTLLRTHQTLEANDIALCAPTGRAKARMGESLSHSLAPLLDAANSRPDILRDLTLKNCESNSFTLHSLLRKQLQGSQEKLNYKLIVIDEFSMVDVHLFALLIKSLPQGCRLILLGDMHQLPPVGHGSVLGDLSKGFTHSKATLSSRLYEQITQDLHDISRDQSSQGYEMTTNLQHKLLNKIVVLTKSQRSAEHILTLAKAANDGDASLAQALLQDTSQTEGQVVYLDSLKVSIEDSAKEFLKSHLNSGWKSSLQQIHNDFNKSELPAEIHHSQSPKLYGQMQAIFEAHNNMRILCLGHQGPSGTMNLNQLARELLNPRIKDPKKRIHGELVMVTRNQNDIGLYNGDSGIVIQLESFSYVVFPLDNSFRVEPLERIHHIDSAFAISVHKSQGSEYTEILMALPDRKSKLLTREILYTGITRAKKKAIIHGSAELFGEGVKRFVDRPSSLSGWLEI